MKIKVISFTLLIWCIFSFYETKAAVQNQEEINEILTKSEESMHKLVLENKIEMLQDRNDVLEGNISSILTLIGVIFAILTILFAIIGWILKTYIERSITSSLDQIQIHLSDITNKHSEVIRTKALIDEEFNKISFLEKDVTSSHRNYLSLNAKIEEQSDLNLANKDYLAFLEYRIQKEETISKFFKELLRKNHIIQKLNNTLSLENENHADVLNKLHSKFGKNIVSENESIKDIYEYYLNNIDKEEKEIFRQVSLKKLTYDKFKWLESEDNDMLDNMEIDYLYKDWKSNLDSLEFILQSIKEATIVEL